MIRFGHIPIFAHFGHLSKKQKVGYLLGWCQKCSNLEFKLFETDHPFSVFYQNYYGKSNFHIIKLVVKGHLAGGVRGGSKKHPQGTKMICILMFW